MDHHKVGTRRRTTWVVTLNPVSHSDPVWTLLIPFLGLQFGGFFVAAGRPVPYNPGRWNRMLWGRRLQRKWGEFLVALAGPASNLVQAFGAALALGLVLSSAALPGEQINEALRSLDPSGSSATIIWGLERFMYINCLLAVFNLMPIAPLDGEKVLALLLRRWLTVYQNLALGSSDLFVGRLSLALVDQYADSLAS